MKILVLSDSHHTMQYMQYAIDREHPDHLIHLGDHSRDADDLQRIYPMLPLISVRGNCDLDFTSPESVVTELGGFRFFVAHGHKYGVKNGLLAFELAARESCANVALFGHTHVAFCDSYNGLWIMNPGSCAYTARPSYGIVEIKNGSLNCRLEYMD